MGLVHHILSDEPRLPWQNNLLALADQPDAAAICREVYGNRVALVPYVMPGFALALAAAEAFEAAEKRARAAGVELEGMVLLQHGLFSFGATAEQSYGRMLALVGEAEARLARLSAQAQLDISGTAAVAIESQAATQVRGALVQLDGSVLVNGLPLP